MCDNIFEYIKGNRPVLISMPHNGTLIPPQLLEKMTQSAQLMTDTDWYLDRLYQFAISMGCYLIKPNYSRYVIDLNRSESNQSLYPGQDTTELCPTTQFDHQPIYHSGLNPTDGEIKTRVDVYWKPYHQQLTQTLDDIKQRYGHVLLFEAHSIRSRVPRFFEGQLPDFNFGTYNGQSCSSELSEQLDKWQPKGYSKVLNGRFKGGYITRAYGAPENNVHSVQLELSQATYMNEEGLQYAPDKANRVVERLKEVFDLFDEFNNQ